VLRSGLRGPPREAGGLADDRERACRTGGRQVSMLHTQATTRRGSSTVLRRWLHSLCASTVLLGGAGPATLEAQPATAAASSAYSEVEIKAAFLYNFGSYVQWPWEADASDPITFAVLGAAGVEQALERLVEGRTLQNRPV